MIAAYNIDGLIKSLEEASTFLLHWFDNNLLKNNSDKRHLLVSIKENIIVKIHEYEIENSGCEKLLAVELDLKLNLDDQISDICKNARGKLNALVRITPFMGLSKRSILMNAFLNSHFSYCPLIWTYHSRTSNRRINMLHERCSRFNHNDNSHGFHNY